MQHAIFLAKKASGQAAGLGLALLVLAGAADAQTIPASVGKPEPPSKEILDQRQIELRGIQDTLKASEDQRKKIEAEIESFRADRAKLAAALVDAASKVSSAERRTTAVERRLETATGSEEAIRKSLEGRRGTIAEVLAALQRMGRKPPPAVLVAPEDMLQAIRTSMLLGAVIPELRSEVSVLASDLGELVKLRRSIIDERESLRTEVATLGGERQRLAALVDARQRAVNEAEQALKAEHGRAAELARQATDLKDLIGKMEGEISAAQRAAEAAAKADERNRKLAALQPPSTKPKNPFGDPARLSPAIAFTDAKGLLPIPAAGTAVKNWGAPDGFGGAEKGLSIATAAKASVASPTDGWVAFSGPYRTYGQLLIINAGGGYYVVLAGMERINVEVGQFVLAGEPVASMGDGRARTATAIAIGAAQPILYVEFRKDGAAIDPGPWWAKPELEKVRG